MKTPRPAAPAGGVQLKVAGPQRQGLGYGGNLWL